MTLQEMKMLFAYNSWANDRILQALEKVADASYKKDLGSSYGGLHGTMTHIVGAEKIWLSRWVGKPESRILSVEEAPDLAPLKRIWEQVARATARFLGTMSDKKLNASFSYVSTEGQHYENTYQQALQHVVNHSSYHRGQIAALMRQVGETPAGTDLITFYRHSR